MCLTLLFFPAFSQNISGFIKDENNNPVAFANVFVRELNTGTATDAKGYYFLSIDPGVYNLVYSSIGYQPKTIQVIISDKPLKQDMILPASNAQLNEVVVKASRKDPAYEIIQHVIDNKEKFLTQVKTARTQVYLRATEVIDVKKKKAQADKEEAEESSKEGPPLDQFAAEKKKEEERLQRINMVEMQLTLNFQYPDQYKEERTGFKAYGSKEGLFIPVFNESDFNFYQNLVYLKGISEVPVISPVSKLAVLSYKYKLEEVLVENTQVVYKIRVTPRKTGDATCKGILYINDSTWNINRLELTLEKGGLKFYDAFTIKQTYQNMGEEVWIPSRQEFIYQTKAGAKSFQGNTVWVFTDFQKDYVFPPKFFGNEVSITTKEAYERDSSYWKSARAEPLTIDQQKVIAYRDSVEAAHKTKAYLDSVETRFNKITVGEVLYHGVGFRKEATKRNIYISPLLSLINFEVIGGFRLGPYVSYFRRFENGRRLYTSASFSIGLKNTDWQGSIGFWTRYQPYRLGDVSVRAGRSFHSINSFDAYLNQLRISNYILHEHVDLFHRIELVNGLYLGTELGFHNRHSVEDYDRTSIINRVIDEDDPLVFENYQALISTVRLAYTPKQRFMSEPNQKVVLGSKFPTFSISHRRGWNGLLTSDVNFDYIELGIEQNLLLGTLGNSRYALMAGKFVNTKNLPYVDLKRFRQSDPYLYSDPLHSFQLLDTSLSATGLFLEGHYIHHFNGAMINNLPLIKKTKIRTVAGAGAMWIQQSNYRYEEVFGGIERIFKLGARRRLRLGVYGVISQTNHRAPETGYKISFDIIDTWKREWSY
ncbi:carboxypeptidase-like regulatory domain-containing protein [Rhodocytophaga rosea]|uniref:Carboxypeptidase-like regulatory domain-containing protein n=2 Tax=Rhodocytophaga rosea TaxID=2704465 RepID=A0A6C0GX81_9BACT|nr:carboxypeptidase-like regulatory domain-containing protein [Rhodocytophaga rosea]